MQVKTLSVAALAMASGAVTASSQLSATDILTVLDTLTQSLHEAGDLGAQLHHDTPTLNPTNVIPFVGKLTPAFIKVANAFPGNLITTTVETFTTEQEAALCAAMPKLADAGQYAGNQLSTILRFEDTDAALNAVMDFGVVCLNIGDDGNLLYQSLAVAGAVAQCKPLVQTTLSTISNTFTDKGDALLYG